MQNLAEEMLYPIDFNFWSPRDMRKGTELQRQARRQRQAEYNARRRTQRSEQGSAATETPEHYAERLARQREYHRRKRQSAIGEEDEGTARGLAPVDISLVEAIDCQLQTALGAHGLDECICAVCDRLCLRSKAVDVTEQDATVFGEAQRVLKSVNLPVSLTSCYNCEDVSDSLSGMLLSRGGVRRRGDEIVLTACDECMRSLSKQNGKPPKFAIANGFFIGHLPREFDDVRWIETIMSQLVTVVAQTRVMRGGNHRAIRSHCLVFDASPGPPATLLPRRVDREGNYRVVLAGPFTDGQKDHVRRLHSVRGSIVSALLSFYTENNPFYEHVALDLDYMNEMDEVTEDGAICESLLAGDIDDVVAFAIDSEQETVSGQSDTVLAVGEEDECNVIERNVLMADISSSPSISVDVRVSDMNPNETESIPQLRVQHSSKFALSTAIEAKMYPHLFPFGRGHPDEIRSVYVSKRDCMRYYASLSDRRFARDPTFLLTAFSRLALEKMYTTTSVKCRRSPTIFRGFEHLSTDDIKAALIRNENRQRGHRPPVSINRDAERFLRSVELGCVSVWGSSAERSQCRQEAFAYQTYYGQPALFVTLTPNSDNSYAMAHYTGKMSVESLFDWLEAKIPTHAEMKNAAMSDDSASARLFMRTVDAFINHVLGIDPDTKRSRPSGGLFGRTKAYYGMVETQGRGTLHIHFLVWLEDAPANSVEFEQRMSDPGNQFARQLVAYADSIVTNEWPLSSENLPCKRCEARGKFQPLPIPSACRAQDRKRFRRNEELLEPALIICMECGQTSSVQHIIRRLLKQNRPPFWPPPLRPLLSHELERRIQSEAESRVNRVFAAQKIHDREQFQAAKVASAEDAEIEILIALADDFRGKALHPSDDWITLDTMSRLIQMGPPTLDAERMAAGHKGFMMATLVSSLNMHWWTHTGSCFKQSRASVSPSVCRYGFPKERVDATTIESDGIKLRRHPGSEYVNGYNPVIMANFKCNHDIQILCGGKGVTDRIYYCCKYVTKSQRLVDSVTAVALACFQRRLAKEVDEMSRNGVASPRDIQRRRVTSMAYALTNKQEIAGPLAALYVFRGSCCYRSTSTSRLQLGDALRQLEGKEDYTCNLVDTNPLCPQGSSASYKSATLLDDYVNRPKQTENLCLYKFCMKCYRRLRTDGTSKANLFEDHHPLSASHCVALRRTNSVPVISGPRLPQLTDDSSDEIKELFAKIALVLFKPFRSIDDLRQLNTSLPWFSAYKEWESQRSDFVVRIMRNMDDYFMGRASEDAAILDGEREQSDTSECDGNEPVDDTWEDEDNPHEDDANMLDDLSDIIRSRVFPTPSFPPRNRGHYPGVSPAQTA